MSRAYKCDCCGKCFYPSDKSERSFAHIENLWIHKGKNYENGFGDPLGSPYSDYQSNLDFCDDCTEKIVRLMHGQMEGENKNEFVEENPADNLRNYFTELVNRIDGIWRGILREHNNCCCDGKTSERKGDSEQKSDD